MALFEGLSAFPITPADQLGRVDTAALARILAQIKDAKADSIGLLGSTGAYAFLSREERRRVVEAAVETVGGEIPIIVGVGAVGFHAELSRWGCGRKLGPPGGSSCIPTQTDFEQLNSISGLASGLTRPFASWDIPPRMR